MVFIEKKKKESSFRSGVANYFFAKGHMTNLNRVGQPQKFCQRGGWGCGGEVLLKFYFNLNMNIVVILYCLAQNLVQSLTPMIKRLEKLWCRLGQTVHGVGGQICRLSS